MRDDHTKTEEQIAQDIITKLSLDDFFGETTEAIVAAMNHARRQALEEAANICEWNGRCYSMTVGSQGSTRMKHRAEGMAHGCKLASVEIRALIDKEEK